jgi:hypothetical protein
VKIKDKNKKIRQKIKIAGEAKRSRKSVSGPEQRSGPAKKKSEH